MEVIVLTPRGYCHGVVDAINQMRTLAKDPSIKQPIYVLGMVVHNQKIVDDFRALGIQSLNDKSKTRLELLDQIQTGTVVFTAHGVSDDVYEKAKAKDLDMIDTTCQDVFASQRTVKSYLAQGYDVFFIGKPNHPEVETVLSYGPNLHVITSKEDLDAITIHNTHVAITNQTTMSLFDIVNLAEAVRERYPQAKLIEERCDATKTRQLALMHQDKRVEHCFVVGDHRSNNSKKLVEVSKAYGTDASLIESVEDLDIEHLKTLRVVSVTSGASTPSQLTKEVIDYLRHFDSKNIPKTNPKSTVLKKNIFAA